MRGTARDQPIATVSVSRPERSTVRATIRVLLPFDDLHTVVGTGLDCRPARSLTEKPVSQIESMPVTSDDPRHQFYELTVFDVIRETADANSFIFEIPSEFEGLYRYQAGQFFTFEIP